MATDKVSSTDWGNIAKVSSITASDIDEILGKNVPAASSEISFSDITTTIVDSQPINSSSNSHSGNLPSSASSGDFVLVIWANDDSTGPTMVGATGWTFVNSSYWGDTTSDSEIGILYRVFDGSEGSTIDCYHNSPDSSSYSVFWSMIVNNIDKSDPIDTVGSAATAAASSVSTPSITTTDAGTFIVATAFDGSDGEPITYSNSNFTITSGGNEDSPENPSTTSGLSASWGYSNIGATTGTGATTATAQNSDGIVSGHVSLRKST